MSLSSSGCWGLDGSGKDALGAASTPASFFLPNPILPNMFDDRSAKACSLEVCQGARASPYAVNEVLPGARALPVAPLHSPLRAIDNSLVMNLEIGRALL